MPPGTIVSMEAVVASKIKLHSLYRSYGEPQRSRWKTNVGDHKAQGNRRRIGDLKGPGRLPATRSLEWPEGRRTNSNVGPYKAPGQGDCTGIGAEPGLQDSPDSPRWTLAKTPARKELFY